MNIKFISEYVDGETPLDELEIVCVLKRKYGSVRLGFRAGMIIPFAEIKLFDTDRLVDAQETFPMAEALGEAIAKAFNERNTQ